MVNRLKNYTYLFIILTLLSYPNIQFAIIKSSSFFSVNLFLYTALSFTFFILPSLFFFKSFKIYFILAGLIVPLNSLASFYLHLYKERINPNILAVVFESNLNEAAEFSSGFTICIAVLMITTTALYFYVVKKLNMKPDRFFIAGIYIPLIIISLLMVNIKSQYISYMQSFKFKISNIVPVYLANSLNIYLDEKKLIDGRVENIADFRFEAQIGTLENDMRRIFIFVIGESSRYSSWGINGYEKDTSPRLSAENGLITYDNVVANATLTRLSVPMMITRADIRNFKITQNEKNLLGLFKEAGFRTAWISNQEVIGVNGTAVSVQAAEADICSYVNRSFSNDNGLITESSSWALDEELLPITDQILSESDDNIFIVLHTIGSHYRYDLRYPESFAEFSPGMKKEDKINSAGAKERIINSYDNSILYTDYILSEIISLLRNKYSNSISCLIFTSDHGEVLFDDSADISGHASGIKKELVHVPLFIWLSDSYKSHYSFKTTSLTKNLSFPVSHVNIFESIAGIADIDFKDFRKELCIADTFLMMNKREFVTLGGSDGFDVTDYDKLK